MQRRAAAGGAWWRGAVGACTESLGSETGDAGGYADAEIIDWLQEEEEGADEQHRVRAAPPPSPEEEGEGSRPRRRGLCLPPVMPRASEALVMRAERRGGRLILTEVRAADRQRRGVFRASRDGGRLQLCFAGTAAGAAGGRAAASAAGAAGEPEEAASENKAGGGAVGVAAPHGGEFCQVAAAAGAAGRGRRVEVGAAVVGI
ncbi:unnamed protein product [Urochloa humidicola]